MKTVFVGGGPGCLAVLALKERGQLGALDLEILAVVDIDPEAPAMRFARERGWPTLSSIERAVALPDLELVIELTGSDDVLDEIVFNVPPGVRVMDHVMAQVFWDLEKLAIEQREQLRHREALEAKLAADHAQLQQILDTIPDVVVVVDRAMRVLRVNRRFEEVTGVACEDAERLICSQAFGTCEPPRRVVDFAGPFYDVMETGSAVTLVQSAENEAGREAYFQVAARPIGDGSGRLAAVVLSSLEITTQVKLERETMERSRTFRQIVDAVHGVISIKDLAGRYQLVNPRAERLFGLAQEAIVGKGAAELFPAGTAAVIEDNDRRTLEKGGHDTTEEMLTIDGADHVLVSERFPLTDYKGEVVALCCVSRDVTKQRLLQSEMVQTERLAAVGKLAAGVAHELNNPLTGILTFAEDLFLEADQEDPRRRDYEVIVNEALRCRNIVRDLLDFSRQKAPERQRGLIDVVVNRVLSMIERQASFHNVQIETVIEDGLPEVDIDVGQIQQALLNLVINARDAMAGCGDIEIRGEPRDERRWVVLSVRDQGCGIPPGQLETIFEPFFSTKGDQGNGLGLPAVLSLAQQHGGRVEVDSVVGRGSTFSIVLPAARD